MYSNVTGFNRYRRKAAKERVWKTEERALAEKRCKDTERKRRERARKKEGRDP